MRRLRAECLWKREQTHLSLVPYLLEETHETIEAIETGGPAELCEELGDLLLQVYFHAVIAEEAGEFTIDDVARGISAKLRRRNPHVFGTGSGDLPMTPAEVDAVWQQVKATEKQRSHPLDGVPASLPALLLAHKVLDRLGVEAPTVEAPDVEQPQLGQPDAERVGEELLRTVTRARAAGIDAEQALRTVLRRRIADAEAADDSDDADEAGPVGG